MLTVAGSVPKLDLLSAAVSDLSIPILVRNLLGCSFDGLDSIDFIRILGLPFQDMQAFDREMVKRADGARPVSYTHLVTITIVLYFGVKLQVLFDNNIGAVCIGLLVLSPFVFHLIS